MEAALGREHLETLLSELEASKPRPENDPRLIAAMAAIVVPAENPDCKVCQRSLADGRADAHAKLTDAVRSAHDLAQSSPALAPLIDMRLAQAFAEYPPAFALAFDACCCSPACYQQTLASRPDAP
eukprot:m.236749 g.236749  ORF g.236749 m.236749 type:complete len:126 (+) comp20745_c0_seq1:212-589(+)